MKIFRQKFFVSRYRKVFQWNPLVFHCFRVSKIGRDKRKFWDSRFSAKLFCLTVPKIFVEEPFFAVSQKLSGNKNSMDKR